MRVSLRSPQSHSFQSSDLGFLFAGVGLSAGLVLPRLPPAEKIYFLRDVVYSRNPRDTLPFHDKTWKVYECRKYTWKSLNVRVFMSWFFLREYSENEKSVIGS